MLYKGFNMSGIVCAVRGGPDSKPTINKSIELAKLTDLTIHFLYVVDLDFLTHSSSSRVATITTEMDQMGEFILLVAQEKAESQNITADGSVRHGIVRDEIISFCREIQADYVILGQPHTRREENVFTRDLLQKFVERVEEESGTKVVLAPRSDD
jgi:nucleotide-binding universal stress UspA family protein